ncbi:hypothetical protein GOBAR_DD34777 [Gossypium barbadense]|nr:hypothetical protein GOBAR_DD34777 [Gossypium barbadense]
MEVAWKTYIRNKLANGATCIIIEGIISEKQAEWMLMIPIIFRIIIPMIFEEDEGMLVAIILEHMAFFIKHKAHLMLRQKEHLPHNAQAAFEFHSLEYKPVIRKGATLCKREHGHIPYEGDSCSVHN